MDYFQTSETTDKLDTQLAKAQGEIENAVKNAQNPHFRSNYADLASVWQACRPALAKYEIAVSQWLIHSEDSRLHILTRVAHAGQWMRCEWSIPVGKLDPQGFVAASTYAKRAALTAAVGVAPGEIDDDGNSVAASFHKSEPVAAPVRPVETPKVTPASAPLTPAAIEAKASQAGYKLPVIKGTALSGKVLAAIQQNDLNIEQLAVMEKLSQSKTLPENLTGPHREYYWAIVAELDKRSKEFMLTPIDDGNDDSKL